MASAKTERLEARITAEQKRLLLRAAGIQGKSLSEFVIASAQAAAAEIVRESEIVRLSAEDREVFVRALLKPPQPGPRLRRIAARLRSGEPAA